MSGFGSTHARSSSSSELLSCSTMTVGVSSTIELLCKDDPYKDQVNLCHS